MIETNRLLLRMPDTADAQALMEIHQDPEMLTHGLVTLTAPPGGLDVAVRNVERMLRHWNDYGYGQWSIVEKNTGNVIGCTGFFHREPQADVEIGWIVRRSHWGNGFATEAAQSAIDWAWRTSKIVHIVSVIRPDDARSMRVATKIGQCFERDIEPRNGQKRFVFGVHRPAT